MANIDAMRRQLEEARHYVPPETSPVYARIDPEFLGELKSMSWIELLERVAEASREMVGIEQERADYATTTKKLREDVEKYRVELDKSNAAADGAADNLKMEQSHSKLLQGELDMTSKRLDRCAREKRAADERAIAAEKAAREYGKWQAGLSECQKRLEENEETLAEMKSKVANCNVEITAAGVQCRETAVAECKKKMAAAETHLTELMGRDVKLLTLENQKLKDELVAGAVAIAKEKEIWRSEYLKLAHDLGVEAEKKKMH